MYLTPTEAQKRYGYNPKTLARWADAGKIQCIRSPGGHRRYLASSIDRLIVCVDTRPVVLYARVSTKSQSEDLNSQIEYLGRNYPNCRCYSEYGSGLNFKRRKFIGLMEKVANSEIKTIVVAHKDRLCRFGFDFVEWFCHLHNCQIVVLNNTYKTPQQELMDDFMSIMHCFSSKLYFLRRYEKEIKSTVTKLDNTDKKL
ncbi:MULTISPECIES: IS607 family transposase [Moorena]|uniref:Putative site-specific integrase-resolvase n=1 Tax=Moorena producens 3L TaxID=489825 RepID=F4XW97_9CYAN|nr:MULTISPECIES: IS607 family transposase [Moorena]EGJ31082.1 putative site-specific integrase-resolvase [Moorena producens 3L]NEP33266.1 IS607 family transposase [Moorena sp. SIO3B2]NEP67944.1 IS607 family transposase [Moorena sp. SIO3A5]NEQ05344.1 IS607 family transposase [Moorena sp. SIO4E2]NER90072.1 IS607 family transposase [Moorena sp. SIO3A2]